MAIRAKGTKIANIIHRVFSSLAEVWPALMGGEGKGDLEVAATETGWLEVMLVQMHVVPFALASTWSTPSCAPAGRQFEVHLLPFQLLQLAL